MRADRRHQRRDVQRARALARDLDVVDMRLVADLELERGVDLAVAAGRAFVAFDQHRACAAADDHQRAGEDRRRPLAGVEEDEMQRPRQRGARRHLDHGAVAHEGGVERNRDIVGRHDLAELRRSARCRWTRAPAAIERMVSPGSSSARSDSSGTNAPSTKTMRRPSIGAKAAPASLARALAAASGGAASGFASRISARRSVYFHSSTRRCGRPAVSNRRNAASRRSAAPGSSRFAVGEARRQRGLGRRPDRADLGVHDAISS